MGDKKMPPSSQLRLHSLILASSNVLVGESIHICEAVKFRYTKVMALPDVYHEYSEAYAIARNASKHNLKC
jgi:hypothetical protein